MWGEFAPLLVIDTNACCTQARWSGAFTLSTTRNRQKHKDERGQNLKIPTVGSWKKQNTMRRPRSRFFLMNLPSTALQPAR